MSEATASWKDKLPESVRATGLAVDVENEDAFWKRVLDQQSYAGQSIRIPTDDASAEAKAEFRKKLMSRVPSLLEVPSEGDDAAYDLALKKLGMPEKVTDYVLPEIAGFKFSDDQAKTLAQMAEAGKFTKKQFKNLALKVAETGRDQVAAVENGRLANIEAIKKEWGMTADERVQQVIEFARKTGANAETLRALEGRTANAGDYFWLYSLLGSGKEGSQLGLQSSNDQSKGTSRMTPQEASQALWDIQSNKLHPYHKGDKLAIARVIQLNEMISAADSQ